MKAIRVHQFGEPHVLVLEDVPDPRPRPSQLVVRIHAAGVNPVETYIRKGIYGDRAFPYTPGSDAAGVVEAVGDGASRLKPGDRVYTSGSISGTYAQFALCRAADVYPLPANVSFARGAAVHVPYATAHRALHRRANVRAGERVLIHGATGGVGVAAVQLARAAGLAIVGTGGTERGRQMVAAQGAHHVLDHRAPGYLAQAMELTAGRGFDVILEMAAHANLGNDLTLLAKGGRVVVIGSRGPVQINAREAMRRDASILGMTLINADDPELAAIHAELGAGLADGSLNPVIGKELPLAEASTAHKAVMEAAAFGKVVLLPWG